MLPYTVVSNLFVNLQTFEQFQIRINDINLLSQTEALIRKKLITIDSNFKIYSQTRYLENINNTSKALTHLLIAIATIALFISAVGIMNIVYVSIQERIQEIGIRIAIGANKNNIATQFLLESVVICILGGFAGIILGYIAAWVLANLNPDWTMSVSWRANLLAIVSTLFIGLFFGYFPARKAAKLNPIYALTRE